MSLLHKRLATIMLLSLFLVSGVLAASSVSENLEDITVAHNSKQTDSLAEALLDVSIPYVDDHYGSADGIIDPTEYAIEYTDAVTGITVYLEHNGTVLFVGLSAPTSGWIAFGWQNYTGNFDTQGINGSDLIFGYAPGTPHDTVDRVTGTDVVTVHYVLKLRDGAVFQESDAPNDESTTSIQDAGLLQAYTDQVIGMRIGEVRHFFIPHDDAYTRITDALYGEDLEYIITLTRIEGDYDNPADASQIVYSDQHGVSTYQHLPDEDQGRVLAANGSDDGTRTQLEYFIKMESSDPNDISLRNMTDLKYPLFVMFGANEDIDSLPVQHTDWANPTMADLIPNPLPVLTVENHEANPELTWVADFELSAVDDGIVRSARCRIDDDDWANMTYNFQTELWEVSMDLSDYNEGIHTAWFNATDASNACGVISFSFTITRPFIPTQGLRLQVERTLNTELFHNTMVADKFTVRNNGSLPLGFIEMYLPPSYVMNFLSLTATDSANNELEITQIPDASGALHWRINFFAPVGFNKTYTFTTSMNLHSLHWIEDYDDNLYGVKFLKYPVVPYVLTSAKLNDIHFRSGDSISGTSPAFTKNNVAPMKVEDFSFIMSSFTPLIIGYRTTKVTVDAWGWLTYKETITLHNIGPAKETILAFTVPAYSTGLKMYDEVGVLAASQPGSYDWNESLVLQVNLKTDRFGVDGFWPGYSYTFHIDYSIQTAAHSAPTSSGSLLSIPMGTMSDMLIVEHVVDIVTTGDIGVVSITKGYRMIYGVFDTTYRYTAYNTTESNPLAVELVYQTNISVYARPFMFAAIFGLIAAAYVGFRKVELPVEDISTDETSATTDAKQTGAPPELLRKFATLYSRKTSLNIDLEKLDASLRRGKVKKKEYLLRERDIKSQIETIDQELPAVRDELIGHGSRYRDLVGQLELENEKIEGAKAGLRQLLRRKKKQQISRAAFEKIRQDYLKTIKKATTATDRIILSIQDEAGD